MFPDQTKHLRSDLRFWVMVLLGMTLITHALYVLMVGVPNTFLSGQFGVGRSLALLGFHFGIAGMVLDVAQSRTRGKAVPLACLVLGLIGYFYYVFWEKHFSREASSSFLIIVSFFGVRYVFVSLLALCRKLIAWRSHAFRDDVVIFWQLSAIVVMLGMSTGLALDLTKIALPATYDYYAYHIEGAFGGVAFGLARWFDVADPFFKSTIYVAYTSLVFVFYLIIALSLRDRVFWQQRVMRTFIVPFMIAWFLYAAVPISGPVYAFFDGRFPFDLPSAAEVPLAKVVLPPYARNGMPSFHLTGALLVCYLSAGLRSKVAFGFSLLLLGLTLVATLALGEHYTIDLVVAAPFAAAMGWVLSDPQGRLTSDKTTARCVGVAFLTFVCWMGLFMAVPGWLARSPVFVQAFSAWSVLLGATVFWRYVRTVWHRPAQEDAAALPSEGLRRSSVAEVDMGRVPPWVFGLFFASGFAGLTYEVVFAKALALTFGSTSLAAYTVLTIYMGGMALGAWLGGWVADRSREPMRVYAIFEALIGFYAVLTPSIFEAIQHLYVDISLNVPPDTPSLTAYRVAFGSVALLIPTVLMGATLPLVFKVVAGRGVASRSAISWLYSANVLGAASGALVTGYLILPALGRHGSTLLAAVMSLMVALYALDRMKRADAWGKLPLAGVLEAAASRVSANSGNQTKATRWLGVGALWALGLGGVVTLGLEVVYMHLLAAVAGSSVYAFGLMLSTFLLGLGFGSLVADQVFRRMERAHLALLSQSGLILSIVLTSLVWGQLPDYFGSFGLSPVTLSFGGREVVRGLVCALAMMPAAFFIGLGYPATMALASEWLSPQGGASGVGAAAAVNTLGNIIGVLLVGFVVLPMMGSMGAIKVLIAMVACLVVLFAFLAIKFVSSSIQLKTSAALGAGLTLLSVSILPVEWNWAGLSSGSNVYFRAQKWGGVIDHAESVEGGITTVTINEQGIKTLLTNGKFQGNNSPKGEMEAQASFALIPLLHTQSRERALVLGYGTGMTARVLREASFKNIEVAELSRDLVRLADKHFDSINHGVSSMEGVRMHFTDGRNLLLTQDARYDLISIEITSIWFAGAANLYNKDFYDLARTRLAHGGVLQQWVQLHHMSQLDLLHILGSVRASFPHVWVYFSGGQGVIVASLERDESAMKRALASLAQTMEKHPHWGLTAEELRARRLASPEQIDTILKRFDPSGMGLVSTDNNLYLEYATPKGNAIQSDTVPGNVGMLRGAW